MPGVQMLAVIVGADRVELGPEYGGVGDGQQVGPLGLERPVEGLDPGLAGGSRRAPEELSDDDHGHEPAGAGGNHLSPVVRDGQQQRSQIIIAVQDQLRLRASARSKAEVSRSSASRACQVARRPWMWVSSAETGVGDPLAPDQVLNDRAPSSRRWRSGWSRRSILSWAGTSPSQGGDGAWNPTAGEGAR